MFVFAAGFCSWERWEALSAAFILVSMLVPDRFDLV